MPPTLFELAWSQHGAFTTAQAVEHGRSRTWLSNPCRAGTIRRARPRVYVVVGAPDTWRQRLMIHLLAAGPLAKATGDSALALWCPEVDRRCDRSSPPHGGAATTTPVSRSSAAPTSIDRSRPRSTAFPRSGCVERSSMRRGPTSTGWNLSPCATPA